MKIITDLNKIKNTLPRAIAIGSFDGVHLGHQAIIEKLLTVAKNNSLTPCILFFEPLPKEFFLKNTVPLRIYDFRNKIINLVKFGINNIIYQKFNTKIANMTAKEFIEEVIIKKLNTKYIIVGDDFKFGKNRYGDYNFFKKYSKFYNFSIDKVSTLSLDNYRISSSVIRQAFNNNDLEKANKLLGKSFRINSRVLHGKKNGRKIGFNTVNQKLSNNSVLRGVYCSKIYIDKNIFYGITNAGIRPTIDGKNKLLETYILNFNSEIYGKYITTEILSFIRKEIKFKSIEKLKLQISKDIEIVKSLLSLL